jgi:hypothetical protein
MSKRLVQKKDTLHDENGTEVKQLHDSDGNAVSVSKEGVHFDLSHRNRIEWAWTVDGLKEFKTRLENRIKAVIV